ncbi:peptidyl-prolyl cis-trans isomerase FKBP14-like isoform X1 [Apostichopus japonicus]|uniref:peptidyl-prolyl cis-trans isomerase FKBP14-like isoform X1 n=1 Tax=Stichopus japonicus TaxID=307972 RepID=UPI003AB7DD1F
MNIFKVYLSVIFGSLLTVISCEVEGFSRYTVVEEAETCEEKTKDGDYLVISYTGEYTDDGEKFDDSETKGDPFYFKLGDQKVMSGWEKSLQDMCVGEIREIYISGQEIDGHQNSGAVVPDESRGEVFYRIELLKILDKPPTPNLFKKMDFDGDKQISKKEMKAFFSAQGLGGLKEEESLDSAVENIFDFQDKDKDGMISHEEFPGQKHDEL